jgi:hypothetical protein
MHLRTPIEGTMPADRRFLEVAGELHRHPGGRRQAARARPSVHPWL